MSDKKTISTQGHLPFTAIFQDVMVLRDGNFRQVVLVSSINFGLKNEDEQNAIVYAYQSFLNSLSFPVQVLIQSRQIDLGQYIANLKQQIFQQSNELIRYQTQEYIDFITRLISVANIMDKKFFVIVPYQKMDIKHGFFAPKQGNLQVSITEFQKVKDELTKRVDVVEQGLSSMGLKSVTLTTEQIIELLYSSYNVTQSLREKLQNAETLAEATVVQQDSGGSAPQANPMEMQTAGMEMTSGTPPPPSAPGYGAAVPTVGMGTPPTPPLDKGRNEEGYQVPIQGQTPSAIQTPTSPSPQSAMPQPSVQATTPSTLPLNKGEAVGVAVDGIQPIQQLK